MFVNADMLFHFLGAFCDWGGSFIALAVGFGFVAEVNVRASAALSTVRFMLVGVRCVGYSCRFPSGYGN